MKSRVLPVLTALLLAALSPLVALADEVDQFRLTPALLDKLEALNAEGDRLKKAREDDPDEEGMDEDEDDEDDMDIADTDAFVKRLESDPEAMALLSKHGVKAREFALAAQALIHAGAFLAFEGAMDKQGAERLLAGYTPAQRANIELMRQRTAAKK